MLYTDDERVNDYLANTSRGLTKNQTKIIMRVSQNKMIRHKTK